MPDSGICLLGFALLRFASLTLSGWLWIVFSRSPLKGLLKSFQSVFQMSLKSKDAKKAFEHVFRRFGFFLPRKKGSKKGL